LTILSRYLLKEHLAPFGLGLALILFVLVMDVVLQMLDQVLSKGLSPGLAGQLLLFNLAWIIALAVPMAVLIAVLMAFARLAADHEILAAKACGASLSHLLRPVLLAAVVLAGLMVLFNDLVLPDWNHRARNIATSLKRRKAALVLKEKQGIFIHDLGRYSLLVRQVDERENRLAGITIHETGDVGQPTTLHAPGGHLQLLGDGSYIKLTLEDGEFFQPDQDDPASFVRGSFRRQVLHIQDPQRAWRFQGSTYRSDREMDIAEMRRAVQERRVEQGRGRILIDSLTARLASLQTQEPPEPGTDQELTRARERLEQERRLTVSRGHRIDELLVEIHKKFSIPVACLVFVLVGAPLGVAVRRRGAAVSVGISLLFFWIYWMFLIGGEELADRGFVSPAAAMWAPNLLFGLIGWQLARVVLLDRPWLPWRGRRRT
jgi:lipopolysaccharide export system permease protein